MEKNVEQILNSDLTDKQKEALLGALANEIIEKRPDSLKDKNEELKENSRKQANDVRERVAKREREYSLDYEINKMEDALVKLTNNRGEHIYTKENLKDLSISELEELYYRYFKEHRLDNVYDKHYGDTNREDVIGPTNDVISDENKQQVGNNEAQKTTETKANNDISENKKDFNLEELSDLMTPEEMNAILIMKDSGNYDDAILNNISTRLGVPVSALESIALNKEAKLKEQELKNEDNKDMNNNTPGTSDGNNTTSSEEEKEESKTPVVDTQLEKPKKVKGIGKLGAKLKAKINANAVVAVAAIAATMALLASNPLALGYAVIAGAGKLYMDYSKGKK